MLAGPSIPTRGMLISTFFPPRDGGGDSAYERGGDARRLA